MFKNVKVKVWSYSMSHILLFEWTPIYTRNLYTTNDSHPTTTTLH